MQGIEFSAATPVLCAARVLSAGQPEPCRARSFSDPQLVRHQSLEPGLIGGEHRFAQIIDGLVDRGFVGSLYKACAGRKPSSEDGNSSRAARRREGLMFSSSSMCGAGSAGLLQTI
jgi:hypothetical protein